MCPGAEQLLGKLAGSEGSARGLKSDRPGRIVALAFHVDYFNDPWADPLSDRTFSAREMAYGRVQKRDDLYFTPMLMVDGRVPMLGTNEKLAREAVRKALAEKPGVQLALALAEPSPNSPQRRMLSVTIAEPAGQVVGRSLIVASALVEDEISTRVDAGENAGKTLLNRHAVRKLALQPAKLERKGRAKLEFPLEPAPEWDPARLSVAVFVQDEQNGRVYQAGTLPWQAEKEAAER